MLLYHYFVSYNVQKEVQTIMCNQHTTLYSALLRPTWIFFCQRNVYAITLSSSPAWSECFMVGRYGPVETSIRAVWISEKGSDDDLHSPISQWTQCHPLHAQHCWRGTWAKKRAVIQPRAFLPLPPFNPFPFLLPPYSLSCSLAENILETLTGPHQAEEENK